MSRLRSEGGGGLRSSFVLMILFLSSSAVGQGGDGGGVVASPCNLDPKWREGLFWIDSDATGDYDQLKCEPIPLIVDAEHWVALDQICTGCEEASNRFIELETNVAYDWVVLDTDGGTLTPVANDNSASGSSASGKAILYHAPPMENGEEQVVHIQVTASNLDSDKPVSATATGIFTIELSLEERVETEQGPEWQPYEMERISDYIVAKVDFVGEINEGPPGLEVIYQCDPTAMWTDQSPITGDFWVGNPGSPLQTLVTGEVAVLTASAADLDLIELQCIAIGPDCEDGGVLQIPLSDTLEFEWSVSVGSLGLGKDRGSEVVYYAPNDPEVDEVVISVTIADKLQQYPDEAITVEKTFPIEADVLSGGAANVGFLNEVAVPPSTQSIPGARTGVAYEIPYYMLVPPARPSHGSYWEHSPPKPLPPPGSDFKWDGTNWVFAFLYNRHPWQAAANFFVGAYHGPPPVSFPDFFEFENWAGPMLTSDYWVSVGGRLEVHRRHDVIRRVERLNVVTLAGFLDVEDKGDFELRKLRYANLDVQKLIEVEAEGVVEVPTECESSILLRVANRYTFDDFGDAIVELTASRRLKRSSVQAFVNLNADGDPAENGTPEGEVYVFTSEPSFPTFQGYGWADGESMPGSVSPQISLTSWLYGQIKTGEL